MAKIFISFNVTTTSDIILVVREKSAPLAEVFRQFYAAPHTQRNLTVDELTPVIHIVQVWSTSDGTTLEQLKGQCDIDASISNDAAFTLIQFIVDRGQTGSPTYDPVSNQDSYVNPELDGKNYAVFKPGYGALVWDIHIELLTGGGFKYINGQLFSSEEEYTVMVFNTVQTSTSSSSKSFPEDFVEVTEDETFDSSYYNKMIEANGSSPILTITMPSLASIPDNTKFGINTHNGSQRYITLQLDTGEYCRVAGQNRNAIYVGKAEEVVFQKKGTYLRIVYWNGDYLRVGERVKADGIAPINSFQEIGGWYTKTDYPRIFEWYVNELPVDELGTGTEDITPSSSNRTKWIIGTTKFWVPDRRNYFDRNTDGTRKSGNVQSDDVKSPSDNLLTGVKRRFAAGGFIEGYVSGGGNAPGSDNYDPATWPYSGTETRPINVATNVYRII
jgi:hypothetical protein